RLEPVRDRLAADRRRVAGFPDAGRHLRLDEGCRPLADDDEEAAVRGGPLREVARRLELVVRAEDRGPPADAEHAPHGVERGRHRREREARELLRFRNRMEPEDDLGDDPERPLAAEEQLAEARTDGRARHRLEPDDLAAREHGLEAEAEILDVAVARRELSRGA